MDLLACRTAFCDEFVVEESGRLAGKTPGRLQVVALGAGLCSRPYRLHQSCASVQWFEVDRDREVIVLSVGIGGFWAVLAEGPVQQFPTA